MRTAAVAFILACLVSVLLTPLVRRFALARGLFDDQVSARKIHGRPIPRLGGVAIAVAFYVPLLALLVQASSVGGMFYANMRLALTFLLGGVAICGLGLYDDIRGAGAGKKFLIQFAVAGALFAAGNRIDYLSLPFVGSVSLGALSLPFTLLWIVGVVNALNLIDGLDGLAAGVAFFGMATTFAIAALHGDPMMMLFMAALGGAIVGFWIYNFNPASIFMGDTGSMFLGYVLAVGSMRTCQKSSTAVSILVPVVALGLPIADTLLAMIRRTLAGRPIFSADRGHIHHRLLDLGLSQRKAVFVLYGVSVVLGATAVLMAYSSSTETVLILAAMSLVALLVLKKLRSAPSLANQELSSAEARAACLVLAQSLNEVRFWHELEPAVRRLGIAAVRFSVVNRNNGDTITVATGQRGDGRWCALEIATDVAEVRLEYCRQAGPMPAEAHNVLRQRISAACQEIYGPAVATRRPASLP